VTVGVVVAVDSQPRATAAAESSASAAAVSQQAIGVALCVASTLAMACLGGLQVTLQYSLGRHTDKSERMAISE